jgi:glycolate oxidase iron-sulfur subunit
MAAPAGHLVEEALLRECVHCGLCLDACPTYVELGTEMDSPRGRIHLLAAVHDGTLRLESEVVRHFDLCLGCRGCETACPSGVRYGRIFEQARDAIEKRYRRPWPQRLRRWAILRVFPHPQRLRALLAPVAVLRAVGMWSWVERVLPAARLVPEGTATEPVAAVNVPQAGRRVALLRGCVASVLFAETEAATHRVLARCGIGVDVPARQGCCGALHLHSGDADTAREMARRNIDAFGAAAESIVVTAAGCGAAMKEYGDLLADDPLYAERARALAARVRDATELVAELAPPPSRPLRAKVAYHDACHLAHAQGVRAAPRRVLEIAGAELVPLAESELCCGSAGSYNLSEPEVAAALGARKAANIASSGAACVAAANPGCALQIRAALRARGSDIRVAHPIELLDEAY